MEHIDDIEPINIAIEAPGIPENFLSPDWEKSNPGNYLTITENRITATNLPRGVSAPGAWVKKDFGVGGATPDFIHKFTVHIENTTPGALTQFWAVSNNPELNTYMERSIAGDGIAVYTYEAAGYNPVIHLRDLASGAAGGHVYTAPFTGYVTVY